MLKSKLEHARLENDEGEEDEVAAIRRGYAIDRFPKMKIEEINVALQRSINQIVERNEKIRNKILSWNKFE